MRKKVPEEIWTFPKIGSKKQRAIYSPESMTHPAKMDTYLTRRLIKEYTKGARKMVVSESLLKRLDKTVDWCSCNGGR